MLYTRAIAIIQIYYALPPRPAVLFGTFYTFSTRNRFNFCSRFERVLKRDDIVYTKRFVRRVGFYYFFFLAFRNLLLLLYGTRIRTVVT